MLRANAIRSKVTRKQEHHRKALLAQIEMDANLLSGQSHYSPVLSLYAAHDIYCCAKPKGSICLHFKSENTAPGFAHQYTFTYVYIRNQPVACYCCTYIAASELKDPI